MAERTAATLDRVCDSELCDSATGDTKHAVPKTVADVVSLLHGCAAGNDALMGVQYLNNVQKRDDISSEQELVEQEEVARKTRQLAQMLVQYCDGFMQLAWERGNEMQSCRVQEPARRLGEKRQRRVDYETGMTQLQHAYATSTGGMPPQSKKARTHNTKA